MAEKNHPYPGAPRWAKVLGVVFGIVTLLFVVMLFTRGPHGGHAHQLHRDADEEREQPAHPEHDLEQPNQGPDA